MPKQAMSSPDIHEPAGGTNYSQAFVVTGGRTIYVSGMTARDKNGQTVGVGDMRAQVTQVLENLKSVLAAAGATLSDVVKITIFTCDIKATQQTSDIRRTYFSKPYPGSTLVEVSRLADPNFLVEIEAVAVVG
jgi:2-iminobutanoate/2-iminopropanoate deaminase